MAVSALAIEYQNICGQPIWMCKATASAISILAYYALWQRYRRRLYASVTLIAHSAKIAFVADQRPLLQ